MVADCEVMCRLWSGKHAPRRQCVPPCTLAGEGRTDRVGGSFRGGFLAAPSPGRGRRSGVSRGSVRCPRRDRITGPEAHPAPRMEDNPASGCATTDRTPPIREAPSALGRLLAYRRPPDAPPTITRPPLIRRSPAPSVPIRAASSGRAASRRMNGHPDRRCDRPVE